MTSLQIIVSYQLKAKNAPNVQRASQSENKRCQKYGGRSPFKLTVLSVIHISGCNLDKKQDCEDKVNHGKDLIEMIEKNVPANPSMEDVMKSFEVVCEADRRIRSRWEKEN